MIRTQTCSRCETAFSYERPPGARGVTRRFCDPCSRQKRLEHDRAKSKRRTAGNRAWAAITADRTLREKLGRRPWLDPQLSAVEKCRARRRYDPTTRLLAQLFKRTQVEGVTFRDLLRACGYGMDELRVHLERQFRGGMDWAAYARGEIHIDHIVPLCAFDRSTIEGVCAAFALTNLQPLWARENWNKGQRRVVLV